MPKLDERKIDYHMTRVQLKGAAGQPPISHDALWRDMSGRPDKQRTCVHDKTTATTVQLFETGRTISGRVYRDRFSDLPTMGKGTDTDYLLQMPANASLRTPAHFMWWDLCDFAPLAGDAEPVGLLAIEVARGAPTVNALAALLSGLEPSLDYEVEITPFMFGDQWKYLYKNPFVKSLTMRIAAGNDLMPRALGDLQLDSMENLGSLDVRLRTQRRQLLDIGANLDAIRRVVESSKTRKNRARVVLPDGRTWDLAEPHFGLRVAVPKAAGKAKSVDGDALLKIIEEETLAHREIFGNQLNRRWP